VDNSCNNLILGAEPVVAEQNIFDLTLARPDFVHLGAAVGEAFCAAAGGWTRLVWQSTQVTPPWASRAWD
jgi:hypothetical protein